MNGKPLALVVDDSEDQLRLLRHFLERAGFRVEAASSGERAIELLAGLSPRLAIIDLLLPGIPGEELATRLRTGFPDCLLVIASVLDPSRYPQADAILPKPFTGQQIKAIAARAAGR